MSPVTFGPSFLPELREILLSTDKVTHYGPDGEPTKVGDEPFLEQWRLRSLGYDQEQGGSRVICVLTTADGRDVTATIDARDFRGLRRHSSRSKEWNGSDHYHDLAVYVSVLFQEQIITRDPDTVPDHVRIQSPANRPRRGAGDSDAQAPSSSWWAMRGE
ncbi:MAG: hypothetical protein ACRDPY_10145 [Streptosporangiaceae bacterium]